MIANRSPYININSYYSVHPRYILTKFHLEYQETITSLLSQNNMATSFDIIMTWSLLYQGLCLHCEVNAAL